MILVVVYDIEVFLIGGALMWVSNPVIGIKFEETGRAELRF